MSSRYMHRYHPTGLDGMNAVTGPNIAERPAGRRFDRGTGCQARIDFEFADHQSLDSAFTSLIKDVEASHGTYSWPIETQMLRT